MFINLNISYLYYNIIYYIKYNANKSQYKLFILYYNIIYKI